MENAKKIRFKGLLVIVVISVAYWGYYFYGITEMRSSVDKIRMDAAYDETGFPVRETGLDQLKNAITEYRQSEGSYPAELTELVSKGYIETIPAPGSIDKWKYDPKNGEVR
ncbi:hypothetical protein ACFLUV_02860 [Elusimicrobiota bacterium]